MRKVLIRIVPAVFIGLAAFTNKAVTEKGLIAQLSDTSQAVRDSAAESLRKMVAAGRTTMSEGHIAEHDSAYYYSFISKTDMRRTVEEVEKSFAASESDDLIGMCDGQTCFQSYRLDNSFVLILYFQSNEPHTVFFDSLILQPKRVYVDAPKSFTGKWVTYYVNGQTSHAVDYKNGLYEGEFISYHPNGNAAYIQQYIHGTPHGTDSGFYYSGKVMYAGTYANGRQEGIWTHYWENGQVKNTMTFVAGEHHGKEQQFFEDGKLYTETWYENGRQTRHRAFNRKGDCTFDSKNVK